MIFYGLTGARLVILCYLSFCGRMGYMVQWLQMLVLSKVLVLLQFHGTYSAIIALKTNQEDGVPVGFGYAQAYLLRCSMEFPSDNLFCVLQFTCRRNGSE